MPAPATEAAAALTSTACCPRTAATLRPPVAPALATVSLSEPSPVFEVSPPAAYPRVPELGTLPSPQVPEPEQARFRWAEEPVRAAAPPRCGAGWWPRTR